MTYPNATKDRPQAENADGRRLHSKHCIFRSGSGWYAIPALALREITIMPDLFHVPCCHQGFAGICHFRSDFLPVVCLDALFPQEKAGEPESHDKLLILRNNQSAGLGQFAIRVIEAPALASIDSLGGTENRTTDTRSNPVQGTTLYRNHVVRVLDPNGLYRLVRELLEEQWSISARTPVIDAVEGTIHQTVGPQL